jgi:hypothetical protein
VRDAEIEDFIEGFNQPTYSGGADTGRTRNHHSSERGYASATRRGNPMKPKSGHARNSQFANPPDASSNLTICTTENPDVLVTWSDITPLRNGKRAGCELDHLSKQTRIDGVLNIARVGPA